MSKREVRQSVVVIVEGLTNLEEFTEKNKHTVVLIDEVLIKYRLVYKECETLSGNIR